MHLLQQHIFDIQCTSPDFGKEVQRVVASLMEKEFYPKLDLLLSHYSRENYTWKIESIKIQLAPLSKKNWKEELVTQSLQQIKSYLQLNFENFQLNNSVIEMPEILISQEIVAENLFFDFLKKGIIPENTFFKTLEKIIDYLEVNQSFIQSLKMLFINNSTALIRFIVAFADDFKIKIQNQIESYDFRIILINQIEIYDLEFSAVLRFIIAKELKHFDTINLENWIEFMTWQFYFFKKEKVSKTAIYKTIDSVSAEYWDLKITSFLSLKELLNPKINSLNKDLLIENNEFIEFWSGIFNNSTVIEDLDNEEIKSLELKKKIELETLFVKKTETLIYIENAGLILFHPFLKSLFEQLKLIKNDVWTNKTNQHKAILLTQFLINGETKIGENGLVLNKILCGFPIENVVNTKLKITEEDIEKCESLLQAVIEHWKILGDTSIAGLRETFLQRRAKILLSENKKFELWVKQEGVDVLLHQLPWGISAIKTPWMEHSLECFWV